ncbi:MAG TPA: carboxypeptidase-like regulatory domain-containing protein, partial [Armatimonadota bacterium]
MLHRPLTWIVLPLLCVGALLALAGCGSLAGGTTSSSGYGADAGPWPNGGNRQAGSNNTTHGDENAPVVPMVIVLQGKTGDKEEMRLDIQQVDLKLKDNWKTIVKREDIVKNATLPFRFGPKGNTLLVVKTLVPKAAYSHVRILFDDKKTSLLKGEATLPLAVESSALELVKWTMEDGKTNALVLTIDGTKVKEGENSATLPAAALAVKTGVPTGAITGKVQPVLPNAKVEVYWGDSTVQLGSVAPAAQDGAFSLTNLPAGSYKVKITAPGQRPANP